MKRVESGQAPGTITLRGFGCANNPLLAKVSPASVASCIPLTGAARDDESVLTKRRMAQIASAADAVWQSNR